MSSLAIVIPCYNGARHIGAVVRGAAQHGLPVTVIDDGSTDGSSDVARAAGATVVRHPANQGKGAALRTGFRWALSHGADAILTMDADGQHAAADIPALVEAHGRAPDALIIGIRSFAPEDMPRRSRIGNRISTYWIGLYAGRPYADTQSGFPIYPRKVASLPAMRTSRFDTEAELLLSAAKLGLPVVEVPVRTIYDADRVTHFHGFSDTLRVMRLVFFSPLWGRRLRPRDPT